MQALTSRLLSFIFLFAFFLPCVFSQNKGSIGLHTAKFMTGDDPSRSQPAISDTGWKDQRLGEVWQRQGFPDYHGFAWYRIHIVIPSSLKNDAGWKDSLRIYLAHVNDVDETWLNGSEIGKTGMFPADPGGYVSKWPAIREYHLASNDPRIKWDQENIIAVRVYDGGGSGGIFMGNPYIDMLGKMDGISFDSPEEGIRYLPGNKAEKSLHISNRFNIPVEGTLSYTVYDAVAGKSLEDKSSSVKLSPFAGQDFTVRMPQRMGIEVTISFTEKESGEKRTVRQVLPYLLTPPVADKPQINGAKIFGVRPGSPFFFRIPATGKGPLTYAVKGLPAGLTINAGSGIIQGVLTTEGEHKMVLIAKNTLGSAERPFTIRVGNLLALTPPMGWNSWNCWGLSVSDEKVKSSAHALIDKGLTGHGWMYINIDDGWESPKRAADSSIVPNEKFPDMKALGDFLHSNGIRFGIYSSPGPMTCGGFLGSYKNEEKDAESYAKWGIDYLKYDLCSYTELMPRRNSTLEENQRPYILMRDILKKQPRDIVYSLCQYGWQDVWKWGPEMNGNLWRTTGDIEDNWNSLYRIGFSQGRLSDYAQPGHWNDPDMLIVGRVGWGENLHPTRLTPYEQYTHMSLWSLLSAPLLLGCDLSKLDAFTLNLLTNDEVIAVDQDPLGKQARQVIKKDSLQVWVKELEDGTKAVGIFNLQSDFHPITLKWEEIGLQGGIRVRDLWQQKDLGIKENGYTVTIAPHGVNLIKISGFGKVSGQGPTR
jgi:alpha-galactosidase